MKLILKKNNAINKLFGTNRMYFVFSLISIGIGVIYILFNNNADVISTSTIICFGSCAVIVSLLGKTPFSRYNILATLPIKSDTAIKKLFTICEKTIMVYYSIIILFSLVKFDIKLLLFNMILCTIALIFGYFISDGTDPQKQELKISIMFLVIFICGMMGGIISVAGHKIIESKLSFELILIMVIVLAVLIALAIIIRHLSYKKFKQNIIQMTIK